MNSANNTNRRQQKNNFSRPTKAGSFISDVKSLFPGSFICFPLRDPVVRLIYGFWGCKTFYTLTIQLIESTKVSIFLQLESLNLIINNDLFRLEPERGLNDPEWKKELKLLP